ncbi:MAG: DNA adenine methylase, partial [Zoogloeaceae bacterium]|nr:DNA adenine methylase [Zoogloeaceae bacterium]
MKIPQPFQYQGSKRALAARILRYLPSGTARLVEPFAGSAALSIACA